MLLTAASTEETSAALRRRLALYGSDLDVKFKLRQPGYITILSLSQYRPFVKLLFCTDILS